MARDQKSTFDGNRLEICQGTSSVFDAPAPPLAAKRAPRAALALGGGRD
jgi:hypothetical protein